jgi:hypothetical protein
MRTLETAPLPALLAEQLPLVTAVTVDDREYTGDDEYVPTPTRLTAKKTTFDRLAVRAVTEASRYGDAAEGANFGVTVTATLKDGTVCDATDAFLAVGWKQWREHEEASGRLEPVGRCPIEAARERVEEARQIAADWTVARDRARGAAAAATAELDSIRTLARDGSGRATEASLTAARNRKSLATRRWSKAEDRLSAAEREFQAAEDALAELLADREDDAAPASAEPAAEVTLAGARARLDRADAALGAALAARSDARGVRAQEAADHVVARAQAEYEAADDALVQLVGDGDVAEQTAPAPTPILAEVLIPQVAFLEIDDRKATGDDVEPVAVKLTPTKKTFRGMALRYVQVAAGGGVPPDTNDGVVVAATLRDGTRWDATKVFLSVGWARWTELRDFRNAIEAECDEADEAVAQLGDSGDEVPVTAQLPAVEVAPPVPGDGYPEFVEEPDFEAVREARAAFRCIGTSVSAASPAEVRIAAFDAAELWSGRASIAELGAFFAVQYGRPLADGTLLTAADHADAKQEAAEAKAASAAAQALLSPAEFDTWLRAVRGDEYMCSDDEDEDEDQGAYEDDDGNDEPPTPPTRGIPVRHASSPPWATGRYGVPPCNGRPAVIEARPRVVLDDDADLPAWATGPDARPAVHLGRGIHAVDLGAMLALPGDPSSPPRAAAPVRRPAPPVTCGIEVVMGLGRTAWLRRPGTGSYAGVRSRGDAADVLGEDEEPVTGLAGVTRAAAWKAVLGRMRSAPADHMLP